LECLSVFKAAFAGGIVEVIDVGAQTSTPFLMQSFHDARHHLFEPVVTYHSQLSANYAAAGIEHEIVAAAVSDAPGVMHQHLLSQDGSGRITHSQLLSAPDRVRFGSQLLSIEETPVITLDTWAQGVALRGDYVVKIDVDGLEERIIAGGPQLLGGATLVIVEATLGRLTARLLALQQLGLQPFDIVGNAYYFDQLQQVDVVMVAQRVINANLDLQPWKKSSLVLWDRWQQY